MELPPTLVAAQIEAVMSDIGASAAKTGMLSSAEIIEVVVSAIAHFEIRNLVVDPVMVAKGGARLLRDDAGDALRRRAAAGRGRDPNLPGRFSSGSRSAPSTNAAGGTCDLVALGARAAVVKGGHADESRRSTTTSTVWTWWSFNRRVSRLQTRMAAVASFPPQSLPTWPRAAIPSPPSTWRKSSSPVRSNARWRLAAAMARSTRCSGSPAERLLREN